MRGHCASTIICQVLGASVHGGISGFIGKSGIMVHIHGCWHGDKTVFGWFGVRHERCAKNTFTHAHPYSGVYPYTVYAQSLQRGLQYVTYSVNTCATAQITLVISHT